MNTSRPIFMTVFLLATINNSQNRLKSYAVQSSHTSWATFARRSGIVPFSPRCACQLLLRWTRIHDAWQTRYLPCMILETWSDYNHVSKKLVIEHSTLPHFFRSVQNNEGNKYGPSVQHEANLDQNLQLPKTLQSCNHHAPAHQQMIVQDL